MKYIYEKVIDLVAHRRLESLQADLIRQQATTDYISMMTDVEIPGEEGGEDDVV